MQNLFLIIRLVLFALIFNTSVLTLSFASWNIRVVSAAELALSSVTILLVFTSSVSIFCVVLGVLQIPFPRARTSWTLFECIWSAVLSLFQIGSAIGIAVNYAMLVQDTEINERTIYASMALLVHATWFSSFTCFTYFCLLIISVLTHRRAYDDIWSQSPYEIDWFSQDGDRASIVHPSAEFMPHQIVDSWYRFMSDVECAPIKRKRAPRAVVEKAPWAEDLKVRRGVDNPFARKPEASPPSTTTPLRIQPKAASRDPTSDHSRFLERFCESRTLTRPQNPPQVNDAARFPDTVRDHDLPIPLPRLSKWMRAGA
jgi:hypothetical protein